MPSYPPTRDALFKYQMGQEKLFVLTLESLFVAKICGVPLFRLTFRYWNLKRLDGMVTFDDYIDWWMDGRNSPIRQIRVCSRPKAHVITAGELPDTERIDSSLASKIAIISVPKQRELVRSSPALGSLSNLERLNNWPSTREAKELERYGKTRYILFW